MHSLGVGARNRDDLFRGTANLGFIAQHAFELPFRIRPMPASGGMFDVPLPDVRLHVVLEQHRVSQLGNVGRRRQEIANDRVEFLQPRQDFDQAQ